MRLTFSLWHLLKVKTCSTAGCSAADSTSGTACGKAAFGTASDGDWHWGVCGNSAGSGPCGTTLENNLPKVLGSWIFGKNVSCYKK